MDIVRIFFTFLFGYILIIIFDYIWLGNILKDFIINQFGNLINVKNGNLDVKLIYGLIAWSIIVIGCLFFATLNANSYLEVFFYGTLLGFIIYGTYDFTSLTFIENYPIKFAFIDIIWGTFLCGIISVLMFGFNTFLTKFF